MGTIPILKQEDLFQKDDYGKPISARLSEVLRRNVTKNDYANIAIKTNVSFSTIRDVVYRTNSLTKVNANAILLLIHAAYENSIAYKLQTEGDMLYLNDLLKF